MAPPLIQLKDIKLTFGGTPLLSGVELSVSTAERVCLIGRNGSGKSTLLKIAAGMIEPDRGSRFVQPGATIRYLPQEPDFSGFDTTLAYVEAGLNPGDDHYQARYLVEQLGLSGFEDPAHISGGEARRTALAMRWLISYSRDRNEKSMPEKLAAEVIAASKGEGNAVKKKEDTHRMADANKAFAHYRW